MEILYGWRDSEGLCKNALDQEVTMPSSVGHADATWQLELCEPVFSVGLVPSHPKTKLRCVCVCVRVSE